MIHMSMGQQADIRGTVKQFEIRETFQAFFFGMRSTIQKNARAVTIQLKAVRAYFATAAKYRKIDYAI